SHESNESNSEISDDNLEPEVTPVLCGNQRGRCRPRLTRTNQSTSNSRGNCGKYDNIENSVIVNYWRKTGILASVSHEEIEVATNSQNTLLEQQEQDIDMLVIDLTFQDPNPEIKDQLNIYLNLNDLHITTKERLEDSEIIKIVLDEANQCKNRDPDDSDEEQPEIPISERLMSLNKFISFFEQ
ncbi:28499_t:CDS:2, partial [Dentiscutata erythropus]